MMQVPLVILITYIMITHYIYTNISKLRVYLVHTHIYLLKYIIFYGLLHFYISNINTLHTLTTNT